MNNALALLFARAWTSIIAIGTFFIVGRFLTPEAFGVFALASAIAVLPICLIGSGAYEFLVGRDPKGERQADAETFALLTGLAATVTLLAFAAGAKLVFHSDEAAILLAGFSLGALVWGVATSREAMLIRDRRGAVVTMATFFAEIAGVITLVASFMLGAGVYSLLFARLMTQTTSAVSLIVATARPIRLSANASAMAEIARFAGGVAGSRALGWGYAYSADLMLGWMMSAASVGVFRMGYRVFSAAIVVLVFAPGPALLAILADAASRGAAAMRRSARRIMEATLALATPVFVGLGTLAGLIVDLLLPEVWAPAGSIITALCLSAPFAAAQVVVNNVYLAHGRSKDYFVQQAILHPFLFAGLFFLAPKGAIAVALTLGAFRVVATLTPLFFARELGLAGRWGAVCALVRNLGAGAAMAAWAGLGVHYAMQLDPILERLAVAALAELTGLLVYAFALRVLAPHGYRTLRAMIRFALARWRARRRRAPAEAGVAEPIEPPPRTDLP